MIDKFFDNFEAQGQALVYEFLALGAVACAGIAAVGALSANVAKSVAIRRHLKAEDRRLLKEAMKREEIPAQRRPVPRSLRAAIQNREDGIVIEGIMAATAAAAEARYDSAACYIDPAPAPYDYEDEDTL
jgi:hypothetical protein